MDALATVAPRAALWEERFDTHEAALERIWGRLSRAVRDRRSPWHTPAVATVGLNGAPEARVMVLRGADRAARQLRLHSDARAAKAAEVAANPAVTLLFYDAAAKLQVRARGMARFLTDGPAVEAAWAATRPFGRRCYAAPVAPGTVSSVPASGLPAELEAREPTPAESEMGRAHFGVLLADVASLEWLHLAHDGHRRGVLRFDGGAWVGEWLLP